MANSTRVVLVGWGWLVSGLVLSGSLAAGGVVYEVLPIGDPNNVADATSFGAVSYEYYIGKYEVTIGQYAEFLNKVAKADPNGLYNTQMGTSPTWPPDASAGVGSAGGNAALPGGDTAILPVRATKDRSANGTSASVGRAGRITRSNSRNGSGWMRPDRGGAEELPV